MEIGHALCCNCNVWCCQFSLQQQHCKCTITHLQLTVPRLLQVCRSSTRGISTRYMHTHAHCLCARTSIHEHRPSVYAVHYYAVLRKTEVHPHTINILFMHGLRQGGGLGFEARCDSPSSKSCCFTLHFNHPRNNFLKVWDVFTALFNCHTSPKTCNYINQLALTLRLHFPSQALLMKTS